MISMNPVESNLINGLPVSSPVTKGVTVAPRATIQLELAGQTFTIMNITDEQVQVEVTDLRNGMIPTAQIISSNKDRFEKPFVVAGDMIQISEPMANGLTPITASKLNRPSQKA